MTLEGTWDFDLCDCREDQPGRKVVIDLSPTSSYENMIQKRSCVVLRGEVTTDLCGPRMLRKLLPIGHMLSEPEKAAKLTTLWASGFSQ